MSNERITLRRPEAVDGSALHALISACPPLDENSIYCNLLQCTHFAASSVVAERNRQLVAAISGYLVPGREDTLFIWQVAVSESARGQGLGRRMINDILARPECSGVRYIETTVTASNEASWALFKGFARRADAVLEQTELFDSTRHFNGEKPSEILARIGPLATQAGSGSEQGTTEHEKEMIA